MTLWTCATCGVEHPDTERPPTSCAICSDERQRVPPAGQRWTTQAELAAQGCAVVVSEPEPDLFAVEVSQRVGIGHRPLLLRTPGGNLLWDPPGYVDHAGVEAVRARGGVAVIASSHPHLTGASIQWSHALGRVPVLVAAADAAWVRRPDPVVELWSGVREVLPGVTLVPCGGHFAGSAVAHWSAGADGAGVLLTGDTVAIGGDLASVNVMRSYVNNVPLPERAVRRILAAIEPYPYDRLYDGWDVIASDARAVVETTLERYVAWLRGDVDEDADARTVATATPASITPAPTSSGTVGASPWKNHPAVIPIGGTSSTKGVTAATG